MSEPQNFYREILIISNPNGSISYKEVWRGTSVNYKPSVIPANSFRTFELYVWGRGWVQVDRPIWAGSIGQTNPSQDELE